MVLVGIPPPFGFVLKQNISIVRYLLSEHPFHALKILSQIPAIR